MTRPLTRADKIEVFRLATRPLVARHGDRFEDGMSDAELEVALKDCLGIFGGSGGPERLSITYQGAGLKIWGAWHVQNHVTTPPLFAGTQTIRMAREVYAIPDPENKQMSLFKNPPA